MKHNYVRSCACGCCCYFAGLLGTTRQNSTTPWIDLLAASRCARSSLITAKTINCDIRGNSLESKAADYCYSTHNIKNNFGTVFCIFRTAGDNLMGGTSGRIRSSLWLSLVDELASHHETRWCRCSMRVPDVETVPITWCARLASNSTLRLDEYSIVPSVSIMSSHRSSSCFEKAVLALLRRFAATWAWWQQSAIWYARNGGRHYCIHSPDF